MATMATMATTYYSFTDIQVEETARNIAEAFSIHYTDVLIKTGIAEEILIVAVENLLETIIEEFSMSETVQNLETVWRLLWANKFTSHGETPNSAGKYYYFCINNSRLKCIRDKAIEIYNMNHIELLRVGEFVEPEPPHNSNTDISGMENINEMRDASLIKKWIKLMPTEQTILFEEYNRKDNFTLIADIVLDTELFATGKKQGQKKRNTLIQFIPKISNKEFNKKTEWLYLLLINGRIVKIGGTRTGLKSRGASYLCGHHIEERGKSGDCSKTNGFVYNTFAFYLQLGCKIEMYGYELPLTQMTIEVFGKEIKISAQTYHAYESIFLEDYKTTYSEYPLLSDNCDPNYKI